MSKIDALMGELSQEAGAIQLWRSLAQVVQQSEAPILRVVGSSDDLPLSTPLPQNSPPHDWSALVERVRSAAAWAREVEADSREQEFRVRELLERVREDIKAATDRAQTAEAQARDIQSRADALLKAADERVKAAEERAQIAESWLTLIKKTFAEEFDGANALKRSA